MLNFQIEQAIKNLNNNDIMKNFAGGFPANYMNKFIDFKSMISEKTGKYPFLIANTDSSETRTVHIGGAYLILNQKLIFFFFNFSGIEGLENFIIQDNEKVIQKIFGIEKMTRTDTKITLVNINFSVKAFKKLSLLEINNLSDTARHFFILLSYLEISSKSTIF